MNKNTDGIVTEKQEEIKLSDDFKERLLKALKEPSESFEFSS